MNPLSIRARNYRTFDELDLDLPAGCVAIIGENGAGKSSIVNVIDLTLFGPESRTLADQHAEDSDGDLMLELTFKHAGSTYRVRRTFSPAGRGKTTVDFEQHHAGAAEVYTDGEGLERVRVTEWDWEPLTRETAAATQEAICATLGLSRQTFRASAFLAQGDGAAFTDAQPRDRKRILCEVLGLDIWDRLLERARADRRTVEDETQQLAGALAVAERDLELKSVAERDRVTAQSELGSAKEKLAAADVELLGVTERLNKARAIAAAQLSAERALETARQQHGETIRRDTVLVDELRVIDERLAGRDMLAEIAETQAHLEQRRDELTAALAQADERDRLILNRNKLLAEVDELNAKAEQLRRRADEVDMAHDESATCDRCGQHLDAEARKRAVASYQADARDLEQRAKDIDDQAQEYGRQIEQLPAERPDREQLAVFHDEIQRAQHAHVQLAALDEAANRKAAVVSEITEVRASLPERERAVTTAQNELRALLADDGAQPLAELEDAARDAAAEVMGWRDMVADHERTLARCEERLARLVQVEAEAITARARVSELQGQLDLLVALEKAYGRDGIPALIIENAAIPQLEVEASRILAELGTPYRVELRTERALKSGEGSRDTLDVIVVGELGERPYETFSGGERTRINLALRIALARLLAHRRGAESRLLAIDEPEYLDEPGTARLAEVLRGLSGDFDRILLVSHVPGLRDAFDQTLSVVKDGARSRVDTGVEQVEREAVAA